MAHVFETADAAYYDLLKAYADYNKDHPTDAERIIWEFLKEKTLGHKFTRQHIIKDYIVDFVCLHHKLVIEIDGQYHLDNKQIIKDNSRTEDLQAQGFHVIRFTNEEVLNNPKRVFWNIKDTLMKIIPPKASAKPTTGKTNNAAVLSPLPEGLGEAVTADAWAVDAACSGNPGPMEYQAIDLQTGYRVFHFGPMRGTLVSSLPLFMRWHYAGRRDFTPRPSIPTATTPYSG
jgi:very-short-patch-repair endonuclease